MKASDNFFLPIGLHPCLYGGTHKIKTLNQRAALNRSRIERIASHPQIKIRSKIKKQKVINTLSFIIISWKIDWLELLQKFFIQSYSQGQHQVNQGHLISEGVTSLNVSIMTYMAINGVRSRSHFISGLGVRLPDVLFAIIGLSCVQFSRA